MLIQFETFSGDELNKPMASVQILLLLYTIYNMYITCMLLKYNMFTLIQTMAKNDTVRTFESRKLQCINPIKSPGNMHFMKEGGGALFRVFRVVNQPLPTSNNQY